MSTFTKEQLIEHLRSRIEHRKGLIASIHIDRGYRDYLNLELRSLEIALASLEAEAVGEVFEQRDGLVMDGTVDLGGASTHRIIKGASKMKRLPLGTKFYTAPPAPVSVPDDEQCKPHPVMAVKGELGFLDHFDRIISERDEDIDIGQLGSRNYEALVLAALDAFRSAMPKGAEPVTTGYKLPFDKWLSQQYEPVDVDCGCVTTEAFNHWLRVAYEAGNSPVITDGWVACSERMPEEGGRYWCYVEEQNDLGKSHYQWNCAWNGDRWWVESDNGGRVTHWMPLPAAPQQEVK